MDLQFNAPWSPSINMMEPLAELTGDSGGFEPQTRARSNTWPLPRPDNYVDDPSALPDDSNKCLIVDSCVPPNHHHISGGGMNQQQPPSSGTVSAVGLTTLGGGGGNLAGSLSGMPQGGLASVKKNTSRRNAWGNLSYADLITQAITSAPDKRLTLSQIYEWMVSNVPYFKDKGDSNSSAGWKNSIRHNLSLHNRFMRVQNEGTGKSSWWMINPDAKPGKSVRRRAASMETSKFEKRRGRVKKKVEALRNGMTADATPSPSSSVSEGLDMFPDSPLHSATGFQLSPDFRPRASSAASSCGRLSPIPAIVGVEPDWSSPTQYQPAGSNQQTNNDATQNTLAQQRMSNNTSGDNYTADQLAGNLEQGMKLHTTDVYMQGYVNGPTGQQGPGGVPPPPPYSATFETNAYTTSTAQTHRDLAVSLSQQQQQQSNQQQIPPQYHNVLPSQCPLHRLQSCNCMQSPICKIENLSPSSGMSPSYPQSEPSPDPIGSSYLMNTSSTPPSNGSSVVRPSNGGGNTPSNCDQSNTSTSGAGCVTPSSIVKNTTRPSSNSPPVTPTPNSGCSTAQNTPNSGQQIHASTMMGQLMGALNNSAILDDLNLNIETLHGFDCNVDEVIKHELSMEGSLDFNFAAQHHHHNMLNQLAQSSQHHHHHHFITTTPDSNLLNHQHDLANNGSNLDATNGGIIVGLNNSTTPHHSLATNSSPLSTTASGSTSPYSATTAAAVVSNQNVVTAPSWVH